MASERAAELRKELLRRELAKRQTGGYGNAVKSGLREGTESLVGMTGDIPSMAGRGVAYGAEKLGIPHEGAQQVGGILSRALAFGSDPIGAITGDLNTTEKVQRNTNALIGKDDFVPNSAGEKAVKTVTSFLPGMLMPAGRAGVAERAITQGVIPGLGAAGGEAIADATGNSEAAPYAKIAGALAAAAGGPAALRRGISPNAGANAENLRQAAILEAEGVIPTAGQRTGDRSLLFKEAESPGFAEAIDRQGEQFTRATLRRIGEDADRATPEVMDRAFTRIGNEFDDLAANTTVPFDQQLQTDLLDAVATYHENSAQIAPVVENILNDAGRLGSRGALDGPAFQSLRSRISKARRGAGADEIGPLSDMQEALDEAALRSLPQEMVERWQTAREQYRNILAVEQAATTATAKADKGLITPAALSAATKTKHGRRAYARGNGPFAEFSRAGGAVLRDLPSSGTSERTTANGTKLMQLLTAVGAGGAAGAQHSGGGALAGAVLPVVAAIAAKGAGKARMTAPMQRYLGNQLMTERLTGDPAIRSVIAALMAQRALPSE